MYISVDSFSLLVIKWKENKFKMQIFDTDEFRHMFNYIQYMLILLPEIEEKLAVPYTVLLYILNSKYWTEV